MRNILLSAAFVALCASPAFSHGGQFKGSGDAGAGGAGASGVAAPPTNPGGAAAPGPGAPASGGAGLPVTGTGGRAVRGQSGRKATTGGTQQSFGPNYEAWEFWWENNKDRFLGLKERLVDTNSASGSLGALSGRGRKSGGASSRRPTEDQILNEVLPALKGLLTQEDNRDIIDSSILALARSMPEAGQGEVIDLAMPLLSHPELSVQTSSAISLGVLESADAFETLSALMTDSTAGRKAVGGGEVPRLVRAFGALGLGLVDDPRSVPALIDVIDKLPDAERDTKACAIVALGLMDNEAVADAYPFLVEKLKDRRLDAVIKSYIPTSIAKMAESSMREGIEPLLEVFTDRDTDNFVLQSTAIALGRLSTMADMQSIEALSAYVREGKDAQTRHFSLIALGKIASRDEDPASHPDAHEAVAKLIHEEISKPSRKTNVSWAALAGALYARGEEFEGSDVEIETINRLKKAYKDESNPSYKAAFAVSLGLMKSREMAPDIHRDFLESKDNDFRGYAAIALGLIGHTEASEDLRGLVQNKTIPPTFRLQVATSLGLMSDEQAIEVLISSLESARTLGVSSAVAKSLGLIGDSSAIGSLLEIAQDGSKNDITRAFAAVAVGIVAERSDLPFNAMISEDNNYRARIPAIDEILDIL